MLSDRGHAMTLCLFLVSIFRRRAAFEFLASKFTEVTEMGPQNLFCGSDPLMENYFQNLPRNKNDSPTYSVFLPSFVEIGKAEVTKPVRGIPHERGY